MGESGQVTIAGRATFGRRSVSILPRERALGGGLVSVRFQVSKGDFETIQRAKRHGKRIEVNVTTGFSDELGNREKRTIEYRAH